jgi:hypothetical protein
MLFSDVDGMVRQEQRTGTGEVQTLMFPSSAGTGGSEEYLKRKRARLRGALFHPLEA